MGTIYTEVVLLVNNCVTKNVILYIHGDREIPSLIQNLWISLYVCSVYYDLAYSMKCFMM